MFWQWIRWQCLNKVNWNGDEIPAGTMIDDDQFTMQILRLMKVAIKERREG
jgi:hypothetical protein